MLSFTIQDLANKLFQYFINNSLFSPKEHHDEIFEVSIDTALEQAALLKSLDRFEEQKIVTRLDVNGNPIFLLNQPLQNYKQQIEISGATAAKIANVVNSWLTENGKTDYLVNPMEINEWSI